jgi:pimeloyl-ACP methyl ester carboxylesterase
MKLSMHGTPVHLANGGVAVDGEGPVLLLLHGAGMDGTAWYLQTRWLAHHGVRALAVDLPGHGRSGGDPLGSIADMADWTAELIAELEPLVRPGPVHLAGHSMGTFIALETAARYPERVASIVLLATAEGMPVHPELLSSAVDDLPHAAALMTAWGHDGPAQTVPNPTPGLSMVGGARALVERSRPGALAADFSACAAYDGAPGAAAALRCPVHLVIGLADKMTPARSARALAGAIPADRLTVTEVPGSGHMLMTEASGVVRRVLLDAVLDRSDAG